jgi:hypothetical protein
MASAQAMTARGHDRARERVDHGPPRPELFGWREPPDQSSPGLARIDLEPVSSTRSGAVTILRFRVCK